MSSIDINFDVYSDTPIGKDPDAFSKTLRNYHEILWSKKLPNGASFDLSNNNDIPRRLIHKSELGDFVLSSDSLGHTFRKWKRMSHIINAIPKSEIDDFFAVCSTIGGYIIFPAHQINRQDTINQSRGKNTDINDRWDLTLECIRLFYINKPNPLSEVLNRYSSFFNLFQDFKGYVDFFLLQDLVGDNYTLIKFYLPFEKFDQAHYSLPKNIDEYRTYKKNVISFIEARNRRILNSVKNYGE